MDFYGVLSETIDILQREGRTSYRALQRHFGLDDAYLEDLKYELITVKQVAVDQDGVMLIWTGGAEADESSPRREASSEGHFHAMLIAVTTVLQREHRVTYRTLKHLLGLNDAVLAEIRAELALRQAAAEEAGNVLVWTGDPSSSLATDAAISTSIAKPEVMSPSTGQPEAERRQLTVMFCDLVGSTALSGKLDPEDWREVVRAYQASAAEVVERYEGYIAQYLGDGLLIYFGYPVAHEDDAPRAIHTGLGIPEAIAALNTRLEADHGVQLAVRIGIHTGPVVVGEMGGGGRHENLALGETPNIAARLEALAPANTVVISATTAQLAQRSFILEELGSHQLKGVAEPMRLYSVVAQRTSDQADNRGGFETLLGREEEIGLLLRRWEQSQEGLGQVVLLSGEAGIGKSSLVDGLRDHARRQGLTRIAFRCSPYHTNSPLHPITESLQRALGWQPEDAVDTQLAKLEHELGDMRLPQEEAVPLLASLLALPLPEGRYAALNLSPQEQRQQTQDMFVAWLLEQAEHQPLLAVWEDLHWADPSTLEILGLFIDQAPTAAILHVLTFRPEFEPPWPMRSHMTPISLNRLERQQVEAYITRLAGGKALPAEVIEHIVSKTDGVPLYVEELTKMLLQSNLLAEAGERYALRGSLDMMAIPETLQDSLMARLDQLPQAKDIAQLGAVLGRAFSYDLIRVIASQDENQLQASLAQLVAAELLYQRGRPPRARYIFKHALIQDAAYASLLGRRRRELHQMAGDAIEALYRDRLTEYDDELSYHFTRGEIWDKAMAYSTLAGNRAAEAHAMAEARVHYTRALEAAGQLDPQPDLMIQASLHHKHAATLAFFIEYETAVDEYQHALALIRQAGERRRESELLAELTMVYNFAHHPEPALACADQALAIAQALDDRPTQAVCLAHKAHIRVAYYGQVVECLPESEEALRLAREVGSPKVLAGALAHLGSLLQYSANFDLGLAYLYEAAELAQSARSAAAFDRSALHIGFANIGKGAYEEGFRWLQRLQNDAAERNNALVMSRAPNTIAGISLELYDLDAAIQLNLEAADIAQQLWPWPEPRAHSLLKVGLAHLERDAHGPADDFFRQAWTLLDDDLFLRWRWHIPLLYARGALALAEGQPDEAWRFAVESLDMATQTGSRKHVARAQRLQGDILAARGQPQEAVSRLRASIDLAEQIGAPRDVWLGKAALGKLLMRLHQDRDAETQLTQATQTIEAIAADLRTPRWRDCFLNAAPVVELYDALGHPVPTTTVSEQTP